VRSAGITYGYVEPNPEAYARLLALCQMTYNGLEQRNLLSDLTRGNLENLIGRINLSKDVSERELAGESLTEDEYSQSLLLGRGAGNR